MPRIVVLSLVASLVACQLPPSEPNTSPSRRSDALHSTDPGAANVAFRQWLTRYLAASPEKRADLELQGAELIAARRVAMNRILVTDPRLALELAVSPVERDAVPEALQPGIERWRDGIGDLALIAAVSEDNDVSCPPTEAWVTFPGDEFSLRAGLFGTRADSMSRNRVRLHGVELDGAIALTEKRLRRLFPGEARPDLALEFPRPCPVSKKKPESDLVFNGGDALYGFCVVEHAEAFDQTLASGEMQAAIAEGEPPASAWTEGPKTALFIRVDFSDQPGDPVSQSAAETLINTNVSDYFVASSYNKTTYSTTVTPTLRLPYPKSFYAADANSYFQIRSEALALAADAGFVASSYTNDIVGFASVYGGWAGRGYVGSRGTWLNGNFSLRVTAHELGHNYGSQHANAWQTSALNPLEPSGTSIEYGNPFDVMGTGGGVVNHINAWNKSRFNWLVPMAAPTVTTSGTYRVQALEPVVGSGLQAVRVARTTARAYWLEYRPGLNTAHTRDGLSLNWDGPGASSQLLDMTPGDGNRNNSTLIIGRTLSDSFAGIHFTPIAKAGTTPEAIDVVINLGTFPGNRAPTVSLNASATTVTTTDVVTFAATASDPDGDALAYAWDFDDATWGPNAAMVTKTFGMARTYNVRLTVSDMKGKTASATVLITVGTPTTFTLAGTVTVGGQPLADVRVTDGTRVAFTTTDGAWRLTNVPAGSYTLNAGKTDFTFTRSFAAPLAVSASSSGLDFTGAQNAGNSISGTVTAAGMPVAGVVVSDGSRTATTSASGTYTLTGFLSGGYTLTATQPGWQYQPSFVNPLELSGGNLTGQNFFATGFSVTGSIPAANVPTAPVVTDGIRSATATRSGSNWLFFLNSVPNGQWNLLASSPGVTLTPNNFTNPITIANMGRNGLTFSVATTPSFLVSGTIRTGGTPLPGVVVSDGTRTATADSLGRYTLVGVPAGTFTLTPTLPSNTFVPATLAVTVSTANVTGQDFTTTVVNAPPTVASTVAASPSPVTTGTTTSLTVLGADDTGENLLTYSWLASGSSYPVGFSASGTNGAKATTATFSGAGTYTIQCTIADPGGLSVTSQVVVQVQQVASGLTVTPASANVLTGAVRNFQAQGIDQFGRTMFVNPITWTVSGGGTISGTTVGVFTAGTTAGGPFTVTASGGGRTATALVTVTGAGAPTITTAASATPNPVAGTTTRLRVRASDDAGEPGLVYRWSTTSAPTTVTYSVNDSNAAKDVDVTFTQSGTYDFLVTVVDGAGNVATSAVSVVVSSTITRVDVQPSVVVLQPGQMQTFSVGAFDQFDEPIVPAPTFTWAVSGGGTVDATGAFTAGMVEGGPFLVTAVAGAASSSAQVTIVATPDTEAPTVSVTAPVPNAQVMGMQSVTATASDNVGVVNVDFFVDGTTSIGSVAMAPYGVVLDVAALSDGMHSLTARARDAAGNTTTSAPVPVFVGMSGPVDVTPPVVSLDTPTDGAMTGLQVSVSATASDDLGVTGVDFELDGVVVQTFTTGPFTSVVPVSVGAHTLVAIARDASGKSTRSTAVGFTASDSTVQPEPTPFVEPEPVVASCGCTSVDATAVMALALVALSRRRQRRSTTAR
jgi:hypothetical protein